MAEEVKIEKQPENQPQPQPENAPAKGSKVWAAIKEWCRKKVVALKVKPQIIPLIILLVTSVIYMLALHSVGVAIYASFNASETEATGICSFITTLLSLLVLVSFLNAFPKRKKPNIFFIVLVFVMIAGMVACDVVYYIQMSNFMKAKANLSAKVEPAQPYIMAHLIMLGVSAVIFALLPLYTKLIRKINTSIKLESATENMNGKIDIEED